MNPAAFCLMLALSSPPGFAQKNDPEPIGMILQARGQIYLQRGKARRPASLGELLYSGDRMISKSGELTFLFCPLGERFLFMGPATLRFAENRVDILRGVLPIKTPTRCALPRVPLGAEILQTTGGALTPGRRAPLSLYVGGVVASSRPVFRWKPSPYAQSYRLVVKNDKQHALWESRTNSGSLAYPDSLPPLEDGSYTWEVWGEARGGPVSEGSAVFEVKRDPELSTKPGPSVSDKFLRAIELDNAGYYAEAAALVREIQDVYPRDRKLGRRLVWLYTRAGLNDAASEEHQRLKSFSR